MVKNFMNMQGHGKEVKIEPRKIEIYKINLLDIDVEKKQIDFEVSCSKGTYIRSLCEDIAKKLRYSRIYERATSNQSWRFYDLRCNSF